MHSGDGWRLSSLKVMRNGILSKDRQVRLEKSIIWAGEVMHGAQGETEIDDWCDRESMTTVGEAAWYNHCGLILVFAEEEGREVKGESKDWRLGLWNQGLGVRRVWKVWNGRHVSGLQPGPDLALSLQKITEYFRTRYSKEGELDITEWFLTDFWMQFGQGLFCVLGMKNKCCNKTWVWIPLTFCRTFSERRAGGFVLTQRGLSRL